MWKVINREMKTKDKANSVPNFVKVVTDDGKVKKIQNKMEIANEMNRQFVEMGANLANQLPPSTQIQILMIICQAQIPIIRDLYFTPYQNQMLVN